MSSVSSDEDRADQIDARASNGQVLESSLAMSFRYVGYAKTYLRIDLPIRG